MILQLDLHEKEKMASDKKFGNIKHLNACNTYSTDHLLVIDLCVTLVNHFETDAGTELVCTAIATGHLEILESFQIKQLFRFARLI